MRLGWFMQDVNVAQDTSGGDTDTLKTTKHDILFLHSCNLLRFLQHQSSKCGVIHNSALVAHRASLETEHLSQLTTKWT